VSDTSGLERAYRRLVACYPRSFRRENAEEILTVLLATAREGQRRPSIAETADLIRGALRMRMGLSRSPRTVLHAVRLMYLGALAELGVLVSVLVTEGSVRAAILQRNPQVTAAQLRPLHTVFALEIVGTGITIAFWIVLAWANGRGRNWARLAAIVAFAMASAGMLVDLGLGDATYAPADMIACGVAWLIGLASVVLLLAKQSWPYYTRQTAR
jgi:hypothetical protein